MILGFVLAMVSSVYAEETQYEVTVTPSDVIVYVDDTKIPNKIKNLVSTYASLHKGMIKNRLTSLVAPSTFDGEIKILDKNNLSQINNKFCDYKKNSISCGIRNNHWVIIPTITKEKLHANFNLTLYNEQGEVISSSSIPIWGFVQFIPQYKKTTIKENTMFGPVERTILEQYPPKRKEIPPLITSAHVSDAIMRLYLSIEIETI